MAVLDKKRSQLLILIISISIILRILAAIILGDTVTNLPGTNDQISYHNLALRLVGGYGFTFGEPWWPFTGANQPTAHWSFLYTYYLAVVYALFGVHPLAARLVQSILVGILQPYLAYRLGSQVFSKRVGLIAALCTALYAYFIYYSAALMTEPFYITIILGVLSLSIDWGIPQKSPDRQSSLLTRALFMGLLLGAAVLLRQLFLLMVPFLFGWIWWARRRRNALSVIPGFTVTSLVIIMMILPFSFFNFNRFGRFVLLNTNAGYAFYWANHPIYGTRFIPILPPEKGSYQSLVPEELHGLDEAALDQELLRRGMGFVLEEPGRYLLLSLSRIPAYFMFWPSQESNLISNLSRVGSFGLLLPFMIYGLLRSFLVNHWSWNNILASSRFLLYLFILVYSGIHIFSWALIRYRLPVDAVLVIFAGVAIADLYDRLFGVRRPGQIQANE